MADDEDKRPRTCPWCGFDSVCDECWERDQTVVCHSCDAEGRND